MHIYKRAGEDNIEILEYRNLDPRGIKNQYDKVLNMLRHDDFTSPEVKKIAGQQLYRAKLDHASRLLFKVGRYKKKQYALILEIIHNHNYDRARFLHGAKIDELRLEELLEQHFREPSHSEPLSYINNETKAFNVLDKIIALDPTQDKIYSMPLPLVIIGSAGSGKTVLTLERLKLVPGDILYVTHSEYLAKNARNLYYSFGYENDKQQIDFLSFKEFVETIRIPEGREVNFKKFLEWFQRIRNSSKIKDAHKLFEEFMGVISGLPTNSRYLSRQEYESLGVRQSIFSKEQRSDVYTLYMRYLNFLVEKNLYDINLVSFDHLKRCNSRYDFVVIDEVQDLTNIQLALILKSLKQENTHNFLICGDANQIVHPNYFSWSSLKSMFYHSDASSHSDIMWTLTTNYRNPPEVTNLANRLLKIKTARFGSIDRESHYLIKSCSQKLGKVELLRDSTAVKKELNNKTKSSTKFAIIVMREDQKKEAREFFSSPLIFSIQEVKGLEYKNIILYNFVSSSSREFNEIISGIEPNDLDLSKDLTYSRVKNKTDKSAEVYKFFINSLYVAITRSLQNIFWVESAHKHEIFQLLKAGQTKCNIELKEETSDLDAWEKEAAKLEMQGKSDQAEEIRKNILKIEDVPWEVLTSEKIKELEANLQNHQALFEFALAYEEMELIQKLRSAKFKRAFNPKKAQPYLERTYYGDYLLANTISLKRSTQKYGVDFRNRFNETPLMCAISRKNREAMKFLIENGANTQLRDNYGKTPVHRVLAKILYTRHSRQNFFTEAYHILPREPLSLKVNARLIKIDPHLMEHFILNSVLATIRSTSEFTAGCLVSLFENLPESILPARRKKRAYISSILANNEVDRDYKYNRFLFLRISRGCYTLNPSLELRDGEEWFSIYQIMGVEKPVLFKN